MSHSKPVANSAQLVQDIGDRLQHELCDHQSFFVIVLDDHGGVMPAAEDLMRRPLSERQRAADALRMWAARIEGGRLPTKAGS